MSESDAELWLVRHGETEWSRAWRHTSFTDPPLTGLGEQQAARLRTVLAQVEFDLVISSPRLRARRTAELAGFADPQVDEDLAEWDYGGYEGLTTATIRQADPGWSVWTHPTPGGESADQVTARLDRIVARVQRSGRVLVFGHGHSLRALTARWLGLGVEYGRLFLLDTATYSILGDDRGTPVVKRWNVASW